MTLEFVANVMFLVGIGIMSFHMTLGQRQCVKMSVNSERKCANLSQCRHLEECKTSCYTVYSKDNNGTMYPHTAGCYHGYDGCRSPNNTCPLEFQVEKMGITTYLCCCRGNLCNKNVIFNKTLMAVRPTQAPYSPSLPHWTTESKRLSRSRDIYFYVFVPLFLMITAVVFFVIWKKCKQVKHTSQPLMEVIPIINTPIVKRDIDFHGIISRGQFGHVWKALYDHKLVAVKIIPTYERQSWETERNIYTNFNLKHENILKFYSAEKRYEENITQYWIITEYHEKGSLADFLHLNSISIDILMKLATGMANGLTFLHDNLPSIKKPPIAHRDFKSRNVLVKENFSCCISDFGSAFAFHENYDSEKTKAQVGTKRYMAPEVLEGAIGFNQEAFLAIDMYAFGLVMWELLSRCDATSATTNSYKGPYEDMVGIHPTHEDMLMWVSERKARPAFQPEWKTIEPVDIFWETIEECWDGDPEARLSSRCVLGRLLDISDNRNMASKVDSTEKLLVEVPD